MAVVVVYCGSVVRFVFSIYCHSVVRLGEAERGGTVSSLKCGCIVGVSRVPCHGCLVVFQVHSLDVSLHRCSSDVSVDDHPTSVENCQHSTCGWLWRGGWKGGSIAWREVVEVLEG